MSARRTTFYLDKRNGKIWGVCAGLADYTGIDVTLIRIGLVLVTILSAGPFVPIAYAVTAWAARDKPREFYEGDREEQKFWQHVRARPSTTIRDVSSRFRDIDRRLADVEVVVTSQNRRLADEIDSLR